MAPQDPPDDFIPANFTFSARAIAVLETFRAEIDANEEDKYLCAGVGWGTCTLKTGHRYEQVFVGAYKQSNRPQIEDVIQNVSGVDVFYFVVPEDYPKLEGLEIDFDEDAGGFFLRDPKTGRTNLTSSIP